MPGSTRSPSPPSSAAPMWLPPLVSAERTSSRLSRGLKELEAERRNSYSSPPGIGTERSLRSISKLGQRANQRVADADRQCSKHETALWEDQESTLTSPAQRDIAGATKAFEIVAADIDQALVGGPCTGAQTLWRGEERVESLPANGVRYFKVPLPQRQAQVTVHVQLSIGSSPTVWASTSCERPHFKDHELWGTEEKLTYEHDPLSNDPEDDKKQGTVSKRDLFVTLEAEAGDCTVKVWVAVKVAKTVYRSELFVYHEPRLRPNWEARLAEIRSEPEKVVDLQRSVAQKHRRQPGEADWLERNSLSVSSVNESYLGSLEEHRRALAMRDQSRRHTVQVRREEIERRNEKKNLEWIQRSDARRRTREEEETRLRVEDMVDNQRKQWLQHLVAFAFAATLRERAATEQLVRRQTMEQMKAGHIISRYVVRWQCRRRRNALYKNIVRLRVGLAAYARHVRPVVKCVAAPVIRKFLEQHAFHKEAPTIFGVVGRFRARVVMIQKWWVEVRTAREAYIELLLPVWSQFQVKLQTELLRDNAKTQVMLARARLDAQQVPQKRTSRRDVEEKEVVKAVLEALEDEVDNVPVDVAKLVLNSYIRAMHHSHGQRLRSWKDQVTALQFERDLEACGVKEGSREIQGVGRTVVPKPRAVYIDHSEIEGLVRQTIDLWQNDAFRAAQSQNERLHVSPTVWVVLPRYVQTAQRSVTRKRISEICETAISTPSRRGTKDSCGRLGSKESVTGRDSKMEAKGSSGRLGSKESVTVRDSKMEAKGSSGRLGSKESASGHDPKMDPLSEETETRRPSKQSLALATRLSRSSNVTEERRPSRLAQTLSDCRWPSCSLTATERDRSRLSSSLNAGRRRQSKQSASSDDTERISSDVTGHGSWVRGSSSRNASKSSVVNPVEPSSRKAASATEHVSRASSKSAQSPCGSKRIFGG